MGISDREILGDLPLQDHRGPEEYTDFAPHLRACVMVGRIEKRTPFAKWIVQGHAGSEDPVKTLGDLIGALHLQKEDGERATGAWTFGVPGVLQEKSVRPGRRESEGQGTQARHRELAAGEAGPGISGGSVPITADGTPVEQEGGGGEGTSDDGRKVKVRPVKNSTWEADGRLAELQPVVHTSAPSMPKGTPGLIVSATYEREQHALFLPSMGNTLIAVNNAGDPRLSTLVYDLTDEDELDEEYNAPLHSFWKVALLGAGCAIGEADALTWQLGLSQQDGIPGRGLVTDSPGAPLKAPPPPVNTNPDSAESDVAQYGAVTLLSDYWNAIRARIEQSGDNVTRVRPPTAPEPEPDVTRARPPGNDGPPTRTRIPEVIAAMSARVSGPIEVGGSDDAHRIGTTRDGKPINAAHLSTDALWRGEIGDGPHEHQDVEYEQDDGLPFWVPVKLRWDASEQHAWACGKAEGKWKWQSMSPVYFPEEPPRTTTPGPEETIILPPPEDDDPPPPRECQTIPGPVTGGGDGTEAVTVGGNPTEGGIFEFFPLSGPTTGLYLPGGGTGTGTGTAIGTGIGTTRTRPVGGGGTTRERQKDASRYTELEGRLGIAIGTMTASGAQVPLRTLVSMQASGLLDSGGLPTNSMPSVGDTPKELRVLLGGVEGRYPTFAGGTRVGGAMFYRPFATATGQLDLSRGGFIRPHHINFQVKTPDTACQVAFGEGDGTWSGFTQDANYSGRQRTGPGGLVTLPAKLGNPTSLGDVLAGLYAPGAALDGTVTPVSVTIPGGLAQLDFAHPSLSSSRADASSGGVRLRQTTVGLQMVVLDGSGDEVVSPRTTVGEGGLLQTGNGAITGKWAFSGGGETTNIQQFAAGLGIFDTSRAFVSFLATGVTAFEAPATFASVVTFSDEVTINAPLDPWTVEFPDRTPSDIAAGDAGFRRDSTVNATHPVWSEGNPQVNHVVAFLSDVVGGSTSTRHMQGLLAEWASSTTVTATLGSARNAADDANIVLAAKTTANATTGHGSGDGLAVLNGLDEKGLDNLASSQITCSQTTQDIVPSADITGHLGATALTGTMSTTGGTLNGVGTKFFDELSVGDLVGNSTVGWTRVTAVASDTVATLLFSLGMGGGSSATRMVNATIQPNNAARDRIDVIQADGLKITVATSATHSAGSPLTIGVAAASLWLAVWLIDDGTTPGLLLSTQHETLLAPPSGYTSVRRIGWAYCESVGPVVLREIFYEDGQLTRHAVYEMDAQPTQVVAQNSNSVWVDVPFDAVAPRTARRLELRVVGGNTAGAGQSLTHFRSRGAGDSAVNRGRRLGMAAGEVQDDAILVVPCDGAQVSQYGMSNADMTISIALVGFIDTL